MKFLTKVTLPNPAKQFDHSSKIACLGSCFAEQIGSKLSAQLFDCLSNPLGTLFNPLALAELVNRSLESRPFENSEFFQNQELWRHFLVHSSLASPDKETSIDSANQALDQLGKQLRHCDFLILTLGSAWIYETADKDRFVAHNHRLPLDSFNKRLLSPHEVEYALKESLSRIHSINPSVHTCITVSPVRHLRDGLHENNLSKASLLLASSCLRSNSPGIDYFPAYELLLDELRDYRFYSEDLTHPSPQAVQYIWGRFSESYLTPNCQKTCEQIESIETALSHRPHHTETNLYRVFKDNLKNRISTLETTEVNTALLRDKWNRLP